MRVPVILALSVLAACATSGNSEWRDVQRERLDRLYKAQRPEAVVAALLGRAAPVERQNAAVAGVHQSPGSGEVRHIDQQEPPALGVGSRPIRETAPAYAVSLGGGIGVVAVHTPGTPLDDRTNAYFGRLGIDKGDGASLQASLWTTDADLFHGRRINDGVDPAQADASLFGIQAFPNVRFDTWSGGDWRMPIRLGLFADWQRLDHLRAQVRREWLSFGPKLVFEPAWRMLGDEMGHLDLFARVGGEIGPTWFSEEFRGGDDRDTTWQWSGEVEAGLRAHTGRMQAELGYGLHQTMIQRIESDLYGGRNRTELQQQQLFFSLGVDF